MQQKIIPVVSIAIGVIAFALTLHYFRSEEQKLEEERRRLYAGARKIVVVGAAADIPGGTVITAEDIGKLEIYASTAPDRVVMPEEAHLLLNRKALFEIKAKKAILWSDIEGGQERARGLASIITPGMRAISLSVSGAAAVSGMVSPNDRVDVLGTFSFPSRRDQEGLETVTLTVLQDVTVLATGQEIANMPGQGRRRGSRGGYSSVTIEVTPREAELLVFAEQTNGRLSLSLRNPTDVYYEDSLPEIDFEHIENRLPELNMYRQKNIRHNPPPRKTTD